MARLARTASSLGAASPSDWQPQPLRRTVAKIRHGGATQPQGVTAALWLPRRLPAAPRGVPLTISTTEKIMNDA